MFELDEIISIMPLGVNKTIDIEVSGDRFFLANGLLTHNSGASSSDVDMTDTAESFALPATADMMFALINTEELESLNQLMVKQLKNRYNDLAKNRRFVIGIERKKMKLYDVENPEQDLVDDRPVMDSTKFGQRDKESDSDFFANRSKLSKGKSNGFN